MIYLRFWNIELRLTNILQDHSIVFTNDDDHDDDVRDDDDVRGDDDEKRVEVADKIPQLVVVDSKPV